MIHDHNRLAIRPDFFHPITASIVGARCATASTTAESARASRSSNRHPGISHEARAMPPQDSLRLNDRLGDHRAPKPFARGLVTAFRKDTSEGDQSPRNPHRVCAFLVEDLLDQWFEQVFRRLCPW